MTLVLKAQPFCKRQRTHRRSFVAFTILGTQSNGKFMARVNTGPGIAREQARRVRLGKGAGDRRSTGWSVRCPLLGHDWLSFARRIMKFVIMARPESKLFCFVDAIVHGHQREIIITRGGRPVVKLKSFEAGLTGNRIGVASGAFEVPDFIDTRTKDVAKLFLGEASNS
jgi:antitoxin (DNA-binding transcriptional repressor) of toxin-antitoxin stability system